MNYVALRAYTEAAGKRVPFSEMSRLTGTVPVKGALVPVLIAFADPAAPGTARVVTPDDAEAVLGKGYRSQGYRLKWRRTDTGRWISAVRWASRSRAESRRNCRG